MCKHNNDPWQLCPNAHYGLPCNNNDTQWINGLPCDNNDTQWTSDKVITTNKVTPIRSMRPYEIHALMQSNNIEIKKSQSVQQPIQQPIQQPLGIVFSDDIGLYHWFTDDSATTFKQYDHFYKG